jgi:glycosyltransferase involved in cell wall biosynthesis
VADEHPGSALEVSVVIPARDAATTIDEQLGALARQTFEGAWEVIVVDDASTDGTANIARRWSEVLPLVMVRESVESRALACNTGARIARSPLLAFCDADDAVSETWLAAIVGVLERHGMATGPIDLAKLNPPETYSWRGDAGWQRLPDWHRFLPTALGCNLGIRRELFDQMGGFDQAAAFGEDFDFEWRAQLAGASLGFSEDAVVHYRQRTRPSAFFRAYFRYGVSDAHHFRRFAGRGMPKRPALIALAELVVLLPAALVLVTRHYRYRWLAAAGTRIGRLAGSVRHRVLYL